MTKRFIIEKPLNPGKYKFRVIVMQSVPEADRFMGQKEECIEIVEATTRKLALSTLANLGHVEG